MSGSVILVHAIFRTKYCMRALEKYLVKQGYKVLNFTYPSTKHSIEQIVDIIHPRMKAFIDENPGPVHFVGYSMGGLVIRAYLHKYRPRDLGRVVMIGTPNKGSEVADTFKDWRLFKSYGPAGQQLITDQSAFAHIFGKVDYPLGVIAGNCALDFLGSWMIGKENDGKVSVESTKLEGMTDHIVLPCDHTFIQSNKKTLALTDAFLKSGKFIHQT